MTEAPKKTNKNINVVEETKAPKKKDEDDWSEVKEKKVAVQDKRDAAVYKMAPNRPQVNKQKNTAKQSAPEPTPPVVQGSAIPGSNLFMPMPKNFNPQAMPMPMPKQPAAKPVETV